MTNEELYGNLKLLFTEDDIRMKTLEHNNILLGELVESIRQHLRAPELPEIWKTYLENLIDESLKLKI